MTHRFKRLSAVAVFCFLAGLLGGSWHAFENFSQTKSFNILTDLNNPFFQEGSKRLLSSLFRQRVRVQQIETGSLLAKSIDQSIPWHTVFTDLKEARRLYEKSATAPWPAHLRELLHADFTLSRSHYFLPLFWDARLAGSSVEKGKGSVSCQEDVYSNWIRNKDPLDNTKKKIEEVFIYGLVLTPVGQNHPAFIKNLKLFLQSEAFVSLAAEYPLGKTFKVFDLQMQDGLSPSKLRELSLPNQ